MSRAILFHFLCAQHVSDINTSITRSLRLFCWITTLVVLFFVRCVLEIRSGWVGVVSVLQAEARKKWNKIASDIKLVFYSSELSVLTSFPALRSTRLGKCRRACSSFTFEPNYPTTRNLTWALCHWKLPLLTTSVLQLAITTWRKHELVRRERYWRLVMQEFVNYLWRLKNVHLFK